MKNIKYRIPVTCQNNHKAFWFCIISDFYIGRHLSIPKTGVQNPCVCPKTEFGQGYTRAGENQLCSNHVDRSNEELYEGDIVEASIYGDEDPQILEILYQHNAFIIEYKDSESDFVILSDFVGSLKKIGNTFLNPDIL